MPAITSTKPPHCQAPGVRRETRGQQDDKRAQQAGNDAGATGPQQVEARKYQVSATAMPNTPEAITNSHSAALNAGQPQPCTSAMVGTSSTSARMFLNRFSSNAGMLSPERRNSTTARPQTSGAASARSFAEPHLAGPARRTAAVCYWMVT